MELLAKDEDEDMEAELKEHEEFVVLEEEELEEKGDEVECLRCSLGEFKQGEGFSKEPGIFSREDEMF